ncbi:MAG: hypothetical protein LIQ31_01755 [Planctomycetes bacterium]|nr:hypothetical protein [Planctomycetota bacterium]
MAIAKIIGVVKGYTEGDDGKIYLSVEELDHSPTADDFVDEMRRNFNPQSAVHGFGARDIPCNIRPGYANYHFSITPDEARNIVQGCRVEVEMEFFNVRKVVLTGPAGKKRWASIPEIRHKVWTVKMVRDNPSVNQPNDRPSDKSTKPEKAEAK